MMASGSKRSSDAPAPRVSDSAGGGADGRRRMVSNVIGVLRCASWLWKEGAVGGACSASIDRVCAAWPDQVPVRATIALLCSARRGRRTLALVGTFALSEGSAIAGVAHGAQLTDVEPPWRHGDDVHVAMVRVLVADGEPLDALA